MIGQTKRAVINKRLGLRGILAVLACAFALPVLSPLSAAADSADYQGDWTGTTSEGKAISFTITADGFTRITISEVDLEPDPGSDCTTAEITSLTENFSPASPIEGDTFSETLTSGNDEAEFSGEFSSGAQASGDIDAQTDSTSCSADASVTWTATRTGGAASTTTTTGGSTTTTTGGSTTTTTVAGASTTTTAPATTTSTPTATSTTTTTKVAASPSASPSLACATGLIAGSDTSEEPAGNQGGSIGAGGKPACVSGEEATPASATEANPVARTGTRTWLFVAIGFFLAVLGLAFKRPENQG